MNILYDKMDPSTSTFYSQGPSFSLNGPLNAIEYGE